MTEDLEKIKDGGVKAPVRVSISRQSLRTGKLFR